MVRVRGLVARSLGHPRPSIAYSLNNPRAGILYEKCESCIGTPPVVLRDSVVRVRNAKHPRYWQSITVAPTLVNEGLLFMSELNTRPRHSQRAGARLSMRSVARNLARVFAYGNGPAALGASSVSVLHRVHLSSLCRCVLIVCPVHIGTCPLQTVEVPRSLAVAPCVVGNVLGAERTHW